MYRFERVGYGSAFGSDPRVKVDKPYVIKMSASEKLADYSYIYCLLLDCILFNYIIPSLRSGDPDKPRVVGALKRVSMLSSISILSKR